MGEGSFAGYTCADRIGRDPFGDVYRAIDDSGRIARLVVVDPPLARRAGFADALATRVNALVALAHAQVIPTLAVGRDDAGAWVVLTAAVPAPATLEELLGRAQAAGAPVPPRVAAVIARAVAAGLAAGHGRGVVHGLPHPRSVIVDASGAVAVGDWALGAAIAAAARKAGDAAICRADGLLAPEQAAGAEPTAASDVYAAGAMLRALFGTAAAVPVALCLARAMATEPTRRFGSGEALGAALASALAKAGLHDVPAAEVAAWARGLRADSEHGLDAATEDVLASLAREHGDAPRASRAAKDQVGDVLASATESVLASFADEDALHAATDAVLASFDDERERSFGGTGVATVVRDDSEADEATAVRNVPRVDERTDVPDAPGAGEAATDIRGGRGAGGGRGADEADEATCVGDGPAVEEPTDVPDAPGADEATAVRDDPAAALPDPHDLPAPPRLPRGAPVIARAPEVDDDEDTAVQTPLAAGPAGDPTNVDTPAASEEDPVSALIRVDVGSSEAIVRRGASVHDFDDGDTYLPPPVAHSEVDPGDEDQQLVSGSTLATTRRRRDTDAVIVVTQRHGGGRLWAATALVAAAALGFLVHTIALLSPERREAERRAAEAEHARLTAAAEAQRVRAGDVAIDSSPDGAAVWLLLGRTPVETPALSAAAVHQIRVEHEGYRAADLDVLGALWMGSGEAMSAVVRVQLKSGHDRSPAAPPAPPSLITGLSGRGRVRVESSPSGALAYLLVGFTPDVAMRGVQAGNEYEFKVVKDGYAPGFVVIRPDDWRLPAGGVRARVEASAALDARPKGK